MKQLLIICGLTVYAQVAFTVSDTGLTSLSHNGTSYYNATRPTILYYMCNADESVRTEIYAPASTNTTGSDWFQQVYRDGLSNSLTVRVDYSASDANTLDAVVAITNHDALTHPCGIFFNPFPFSAGSDGTFTEEVSATVTVKNGPSSSLAFWAESTPLWMRVGIFTWDGGATTNSDFYWNNSQDAGVTTPPANAYPLLFRRNQTNIAFGETVTYTLHMRWGSPSDTIATLVPNVAQLYQTAYPNNVSWADRRPACQWFTASGSYKSAQNPRGYLETGLNATGDPAAFRAVLFDRADTVIAQCNSLSPKCQGVIVWDLEGLEFENLNYVGDPVHIAELAPEMNAVADDLFSYLRAGGVEPGLLIRPQRINYGTAPADLPTTCDAYSEWRQYFVNAGVSPGVSGRAYECTSTDTWTVAGVPVDYFQPGLPSYDDYLNELRAKLTYARNRWGIKLVYSDSTGFPGYRFWFQIWRTLREEYPEIIIAPETIFSDSWSSSAPYQSMANGAYATYAPVRALDPKAFSVLNYGSDYINQQATIINGVAAGDVYLDQCWFASGTHDLISANYAAAATLNSVVAMTDRGQPRTFKSAPGTSFTYPVTARVYFAVDAAGLAASTTYCTRRATDSCYLSGVLQSAAALDLSALPYYQIRYYDFAGNLVSEGPYATLQ